MVGEGVSAQFLVWEFALRVIFLKKFYQWSYIYLKHLIVKHVFCPGDIWRQTLLKKKKKKKSGQYGTFLCHIFLGREGDWTFQPHYFIIIFFPDPEWVLLSVALPDFPWKHCTPSLSLKKKSSTWDVLECKTWIPPLYTPFWQILFWRVVLWTEPFPGFVFWDTAVQVLCVTFILNRLPSLYYLQCTPA